MLKKNLKQSEVRSDVCFLLCTSPGSLWRADRWDFGLVIVAELHFV